uniref:1-deoxy-D-xylulose 5-phosphate reductoisomerase n=1 Tax=Streptomyces lavendulae TaxID=1914 RepID=G8EXH4_STRLA|nr:1-deoxy-D-xylulose-5-phosphate reductoisomerase B [Streptomyces lavendulae]
MTESTSEYGLDRPRRVAVIGVTGSVGRQAVEVIERSPRLEMVGAVALRDAGGLAAAGARLGCEHLALIETATDDRRSWADPTPERFLHAVKPDVVLNAVVGVAGLAWTLAAIDAGHDIALANKESLVAGGRVVNERLAASSSRLLPVDSEHAALHQLLEGHRHHAQTLTITASGGPFRGRRWADLHDVTVEAAMAHPTWAMGNKNTLDSATLVNKGLELIEASYMFDWPQERIEIAVQPRSVIHAAITLRDGTHVANVSPPDMRRSIAYALHHPECVDIGLPHVPLAGLGTLELEPEPEDFPGLALSRAALRAQDHGGTAAFNAANEEAVAAFIAGRIRFTDITEIIARALDDLAPTPVTTLADVLAADARARQTARAVISARAVSS